MIPDHSLDGSLDSWLQPPRTPQAVDDKGETTIQVNGDGTYSVAVSVRNDTSGRSVRIGVEPAEIEVRKSAGRQVFEIQIPEAGLKQAVEQAAKR